MARAYSVNDVLTKKIECLDFDGVWYDVFDKPEATGVWFVWGDSGNGKTSFVVQLAKYLTKFSKVVYNSLEEGLSKSMQNAFKRFNMAEVRSKILLLSEGMEELCARLDKPRAAKIVIVDSIQYAQMTKKQFYEFIQKYSSRYLIIFISQAEGNKPDGAAARTAMFAASLKIFVEGYRAFSKGRYFGTKPFYTIYTEKAAEYWLDGQL